METSKIVKCAACGLKQNISEDALQLREGVIGFRGFVNLSDPLIFCDLVCLKEHLEEQKNSYTDREAH